LAALAIPRLAGSRNSAYRKSIVADLRTIESAIAIAQAEEHTINADVGEDFYNLVPKYLATAPEGPAGATYSVGPSEEDANDLRAHVKFDAANQYGVTVTVGPHTIEDLLDTTDW